jgi:hypothetical protein
MMPDDFLHDKIQELLGKIRIELGRLSERTQPRDLLCLPAWIRRREAMSCFEFSDNLRAPETLGENVDQRRIDIVDAVAQASKLFWNGGVGPQC